MNTEKSEKAREALQTAMERYDCMGWFDSDDEEERDEAEMMQAAYDGDDPGAMIAALDTALDRYDLLGFGEDEDEVMEVRTARDLLSEPVAKA